MPARLSMISRCSLLNLRRNLKMWQFENLKMHIITFSDYQR
jgi:hypothetical protein